MSADAMSIIGKINGRLMDAGDGDPYLALPSKEEIRWLLPLGAPYSRAGVFDFYHPYSLKNKFLKFAVMALIRMRLAGTVLAGNILFKDDSEGTGLKKTLERSLGVKIDISLSVNPLMDKATGIIVNPDGCVIAYSKMGFSDHSAALINNEYESLQKVRALGLVSCDIPEITSFFIENGATCVVETPSAKPCSISRLRLTKKHTVFLSELFGRTQKKGLLEESAAYIRLHAKILTGIRSFPEEWRERFVKCMERLSQHRLIQMPGCLSHGDFAPWNILFAGPRKNIFLTDWEYCQEGLPFWDAFHFISHTNILLNRCAQSALTDMVFEESVRKEVYSEVCPEAAEDPEKLKASFILYSVNMSLRYLEMYSIAGRLDMQTKKILSVFGKVLDDYNR